MVKVEGESNRMSSLSDLDCGPVSTLSSESSFVVVGHDSMTSSQDINSRVHHSSIPNQSIQTRPTESGETNQPTLSLLSSSYVEPKDIQQKLDIVLQENLELKETLHQNNLAMRQQMETLSVWQNEVAKVQQNHSGKFQQTRDLVIKLKTENTELRRQLEKFQQAREEISKNDDSDGSPVAAELKEERKRRLSEEYKSKTLSLANTELTKLKRKVEQQYEHLVAENVSLRKHLEKYRFDDGKMEELNKLVQQLTNKLETSERGKRQLEFDLEKAMYGHTDKNLLQLSNENCGLRTSLTEKNKEIEALKKKLEHTKKCENENGEGGKDKEVPIETNSQEHFRERLLEAQSEIEFLRHQLDEVQDCIVVREEMCAQKTKQIEELHRKISSLETKLEAIPILEAQVEVYQADFLAEREARQQAVSERENLERILKGSNIQLHPAERGQNNLGDTRNNDTRRSENRGVSHFCPICSAGFSQLPALERHIDECLQAN